MARAAFIVALGAACAPLAACAAPADRPIADAAILAFAAKPFDKRARMGRQDVLGTRGGVRLVADYPCSDLCPEYTTQVIHFEAAPGPICGRVGGVVRDRLVPRGIGVAREPFCVPKVLADGQP